MNFQLGVLLTKAFDILPNHHGISDLGLTLPHFEFLKIGKDKPRSDIP